MLNPYPHYLLRWLNGQCLWVTSGPQMKSTHDQQAVKGWHSHLLSESSGIQYSNITRPTGQLYVSSSVPTCGTLESHRQWHSPIVSFLYTFYWVLRISYQNIFKTYLFEQMPKAQKISKTFCEEYIGLSIFFTFNILMQQASKVFWYSGSEG